MKNPDQVAESIDRFRRGLWDRESVDRPPVGITPDRSWLPVKYLKAEFPRDTVRPEDVTPSLVRTDYEDAVSVVGSSTTTGWPTTLPGVPFRGSRP